MLTTGTLLVDAFIKRNSAVEALSALIFTIQQLLCKMAISALLRVLTFETKMSAAIGWHVVQIGKSEKKSSIGLSAAPASWLTKVTGAGSSWPFVELYLKLGSS